MIFQLYLHFPLGYTVIYSCIQLYTVIYSYIYPIHFPIPSPSKPPPKGGLAFSPPCRRSWWSHHQRHPAESWKPLGSVRKASNPMDDHGLTWQLGWITRSPLITHFWICLDPAWGQRWGKATKTTSVGLVQVRSIFAPHTQGKPHTAYLWDPLGKPST
jgi:hypothetical protein